MGKRIFLIISIATFVILFLVIEWGQKNKPILIKGFTLLPLVLSPDPVDDPCLVGVAVHYPNWCGQQ